MRNPVFLVVLASLLSGCMVGPNYRRPDLDLPPAWRFEDPHAADTANTRWWTQFGDPVLDSLVQEALRNNRDLRVAAARVEQAGGVVTTTRAPLFPQLGYGAGAEQFRSSRQGPAPVASRNPDSEFQLFGGATWELDLWGRVRRLTESSRARLLATEEGRRGVVLTLVSSVANTYIQLRAYDEQLAIAKDSLETYAKALKLFELQFRYGQVGRMNVAQARTQYATAAATIPQVEAAIASLENALSVLLGRNPGPVARGKRLGELSAFAVPAGLPSQLLERRPDVAQAEQDLVSANAQVGAAKALYFPVISLTGTLGVASASIGDLLKGSAEAWQYAGSLSGPLFTAGAVSGQVDQATAAEKAALARYQQAVLSALADVETALVSHQRLEQQLVAQQDLVAASSDYTRLAHLQYDGGYTPYFTVLQAEQQLFPAQLNLAQVQADRLNALVGVYRAMGGGWMTEAGKDAVPQEAGLPETPAPVPAAGEAPPKAEG